MEHFYIKLRGKKKKSVDSKSFDVNQKVERFLKSNKKVLLLTSEIGGGKSVFVENLEK